MLKSESYRKGIIVSTLTNVLAKGIGFLNTLIIAFYFGANTGTDIYFYILSVATLITSTINGVDYLVLIPEAMKIRERKSEQASQTFINFFIYSYICIGLVLAIIGNLIPIVFYTAFSKYDVQLLKSNTELLYLGSFIIFFQLINNFLSAVLTSYKYFTASIISGLINTIFSITFTLLLHNKIGLTGTLLGITLGNCINFVILLYVLKRFQNWKFRNVKFMRDKTVWKNIGLMQINIFPVWMRNYFTIYFLTGMGVGVITSLNMAQMLASLPEIFILSQVTSIIGIKFSELAAKKEMVETNILLINILKTLFVIIIPIALIMMIANKEVIQIVFERGSFQKNSIITTSFCFFYFALLLPTKIFDILFTRLFTSFQLYGISTLFAFIAHTIITIVLYVLTTHFHLQGFFVALLIGYYIILPFTFLMITKYRLSKIDIRLIVVDISLLLITAILVYLFANYLYSLLNLQIVIKLIILCLIVFAPFVIIANRLVSLKYQKDNFLIILNKLLNKKNI